MMAHKNSGYTKNVAPPDLSPIETLANIFFCTVRHMGPLFDEPLDSFPFWGFFCRNFQGFDEDIKNLERIGGTLSHLENEYCAEISQFQNAEITPEQQEVFDLTKSVTLIFIYGVLKEVQTFVKTVEKVYVCNKMYEDLNK